MCNLGQLFYTSIFLHIFNYIRAKKLKLWKFFSFFERDIVNYSKNEF
jgi:hypothetical protein